jgi:hypothetical protein
MTTDSYHLNIRTDTIKNPFKALFNKSDQNSIVISRSDDESDSYKVVINRESVVINEPSLNNLSITKYQFKTGLLFVNGVRRDDSYLAQFQTTIEKIMNDVNNKRALVFEENLKENDAELR